MTQVLKELRSGAGFTQKQLADKLGTTQQTIARWESGKVAIPTPMLKDIATLFGRSVDDLLGVRFRASQRRASKFALAEQDIPAGTLKLGLGFGEREYPIGETLRDELEEEFDLEGDAGWVTFTALDNRLVLANPAAIRSVSYVCDDTEGMGYFASPEAYRALTAGDAAQEELGPVLAGQVQDLVKALAPGIEDVDTAREAAEEDLHYLRVLHVDGAERRFLLTEGAAFCVSDLEYRALIGANAFLKVFDDGTDVELVNLNSVAVIEVPLEAYLGLLLTMAEEDRNEEDDIVDNDN